MGKIPPSYLPAHSLWPERVYTLPEHRSYPQRLNSTEELIESCREHLAVYKLPREVEFVETVPRAPGPAGPGTGKLLRRVLRDKLKQ